MRPSYVLLTIACAMGYTTQARAEEDLPSSVDTRVPFIPEPSFVASWEPAREPKFRVEYQRFETNPFAPVHEDWMLQGDITRMGTTFIERVSFRQEIGGWETKLDAGRRKLTDFPTPGTKNSTTFIGIMVTKKIGF